LYTRQRKIDTDNIGHETSKARHGNIGNKTQTDRHGNIGHKTEKDRHGEYSAQDTER
jgi:hypothetical protein